MLNELRMAEVGTTIWDKGESASVKGLHLRVFPDSRDFYLYYRSRVGKQRRFKIGTLGSITLSEARKRARILLDRVAVGEDPKGDWVEQRTEMTVLGLFEATWKGYWAQERFQVSGWSRQVRWSFEQHIQPTFGSWKLSELTVSKIRQWHAAFKESSIYNGNQALKVLARMYRFAEEEEIRAQNTNPCRLVKPHPERKRKRFAKPQELARIIPILEKYARVNPAGVAFLYLLIYTGSRPRAIERAEWNQLEEFEMKGQKYGLLSFHGKSSAETGEEEKVILPPQAMRALSWLPRIEGMTLTNIKMPRKLWKKVKTEADCADLWARDFRRTFATVGLSSGVANTGVIGELLNHHTSDTTKRYAKLVDESRVEAAIAIAAQIETQGKAG